jgi:hypothetical protein
MLARYLMQRKPVVKLSLQNNCSSDRSVPYVPFARQPALRCCRWTWLPNTLDHSVPVTDSPGHRLWLWLKSVGCSMWARLCSLLGCCAASSRSCCPKVACEQLSSDGCTGAHGLRCCCCSEHTNSAYAYWLFAQKDVVRDYTGSLIIKQVWCSGPQMLLGKGVWMPITQGKAWPSHSSGWQPEASGGSSCMSRVDLNQTVQGLC